MDEKISFRRKLTRVSKRVMKWPFYCCLLFLMILLVGLVPVNNQFQPTKDGVEIFVVSTAVHADIILPRQNEVEDWSEWFSEFEYRGDISRASHVAFGWGDRGFFLETETWDDLKLSIAANALLWPSESCVHVSFTRPEYYTAATSVTISEEQYEQLVEFIKSTLVLDDEGNPNQIEGYAYSSTDAFFDAYGNYHLLNTCNSWVGRALKTSGVRVPWLSPMPKSPKMYIETEKGSN